jgi:hypothetical protein
MNQRKEKAITKHQKAIPNLWLRMCTTGVIA